MILINENYPQDLLIRYNISIYNRISGEKTKKIESKWQEECLKIPVPVIASKVGESFEKLLDICAYSEFLVWCGRLSLEITLYLFI